MKDSSKVIKIWTVSLWIVFLSSLFTVQNWWFDLPLLGRATSLASLCILCVLLVIKTDLKNWGKILFNHNNEQSLFSKDETHSILDTIKKNQNFKYTVFSLSLMGASLLIAEIVYTPRLVSTASIHVLFVGWFLFGYVLQLQIRNHLLCKIIIQQSKAKLDREIQTAQKTTPSSVPKQVA